MDSQPKTRFFKTDEVGRKWFVADVQGKTLGRAASRIAAVLRGKHKPTFTPNADVGDFVIVVNAEKIHLVGKRAELKQLYHNTMYPGGARFESVKDLLKRKPEYVMEHAVRGMLPHNRLGRRIARKLKVYSGPSHPHVAQRPEPLTL